MIGIRSEEQPAYTVVAKLGDDAEVRRYPPRIAASTVVDAADEGRRVGRLSEPSPATSSAATGKSSGWR